MNPLRTACLCTLIAMTFGWHSPLTAQTIPNGDMEAWSGPNPDGWETTNDESGAIPPGITKSSDAHGGSNAMHGAVTSLSAGPISINFPPSANLKFGISAKHEAVHGFFKFTRGGSDKFAISDGTSKYSGSNQMTLSAGLYYDTTTTTVYREFYANMLYDPSHSSYTPDTMLIVVTISTTQDDSVHVGSHFDLDDLTLSNYGHNTIGGDPLSDVGSIGVVRPTAFGLEQNYPNPFNPTTTIYYDVPAGGSVTLAVVDQLGRTVSTLVREHQPVGRYKITFDASELPSGTYRAVLTLDSHVSTRIMTLQR